MAEKELSDKEIEELDEFVKIKFNHFIYQELRGEDDDPYSDYEGLFDPLEFFRIFYAQTDFIKQNKERPLFVSKKLKKLKLSDEQLIYFYSKLLEYFEKEKKTDEQIKICCREIDTLQSKLENDDEDDEPYVYDDGKPKFSDVQKHLETLQTFREKIAYLIKQEYEYEQKYHTSGWDTSPFTRNCKLEREKLEKLARLQPASKSKIEQIKIEVGKNNELTLDRAIFLLNRLIPSFSQCDATKKAKFVNFLTGFDYESARQRFSTINRKYAEKEQAFEKDMEILCKYLDLLGLADKISEIKNDLALK